MKLGKETPKTPLGSEINISVDLTGNFAYTVGMLRQYRLKLNIPQEQLAHELGISIRTLRDIEHNKKRTNNKLVRASIEGWIKEIQSQELMAKKGVQEKGKHSK